MPSCFCKAASQLRIGSAAGLIQSQAVIGCSEGGKAGRCIAPQANASPHVCPPNHLHTCHDTGFLQAAGIHLACTLLQDALRNLPPCAFCYMQEPVSKTCLDRPSKQYNARCMPANRCQCISTFTRHEATITADFSSGMVPGGHTKESSSNTEVCLP